MGRKTGRCQRRYRELYDWYEELILSEDEWEEIEEFGEDEREAMQHPEHMTQTIFEKCLSTAVWLDDFDCYFRLIEQFPKFSDVYDKKIDTLIKHTIEPAVF